MGEKFKVIIVERERADGKHGRSVSSGETDLSLDPDFIEVSRCCLVRFPLPQLHSLELTRRSQSLIHLGWEFFQACIRKGQRGQRI